jgi:glycosyltransferase involved in cell wall biosynthesis
MRVGLVVPGYSADEVDWCIPALRHLARQLSRTDQVQVITLRYPYRSARYQVEGIPVLSLGGAATRGRATLAVWRTTLSALRAEHRQQRFDVLHAFWATETGLLAAVAGRLLRIPTVVSLAGGELVRLDDIQYGDQRRAAERLKVHLSLRLASRVTAGSGYLQAMATRVTGFGNVHLAPLGVPLELFSPDGPPADPRALIHVGTLTGVKDQATLLHALALANQRGLDARLTIAGDGPFRADLQRLATSLGLADRVSFRGSVDHAALPELYRQHGLFVLSSRHEAQGMVAIEAAASGLAVVGTRVGVVPDLSLRAVPVGDASALAEQLVTTALDPVPARALATEQARRMFALDLCTGRFRDLYHQT